MKIHAGVIAGALVLAAKLAAAQEPGDALPTSIAQVPLPKEEPWFHVGTMMGQEPKKAEEPTKPWFQDREDGVHTSMFGTWIKEHELQIYVFYEFTLNHDNEYKPDELGFSPPGPDVRARRVDHEFLVFAAYGLTADIEIEFESALWTTATQTKAKSDTSNMPNHLTESGLGDTEGQVRWRFLHESEGVPQITAFFEYTLPLQKSKVLIGTQAWELAVGFVVEKGFSWGTLMAKISYAYDQGEHKAELGEYAIEYTKRLSDQWRLVLSVEGEQDEVEGIIEFQWKPWKNVMIKINNAFGITSKAADWAPEIGVLISF